MTADAFLFGRHVMAALRGDRDEYSATLEPGQRVEVLFAMASSNPVWRAGAVIGPALRGTEERPHQGVRVEIDGCAYTVSPRSVRAI